MPATTLPEVDQLLAQAEIEARLLPLSRIEAFADRNKIDRVCSIVDANWFHPKGVVAGIWLAAGFWEESHQTAQEIRDPVGSYWHYLLHRLEPDYGNAGYWLRQCRNLSFAGELARVADEIAQQEQPSHWKGDATAWDGEAWLKFCEKANRRSDGPDYQLAIKVQDAEWRLLLNHCLCGNR